MANPTTSLKVTHNDVKVTSTKNILVSIEDKENTTKNQTIESVSNSNFQFTLTGELELTAGDLVKVDSGNYQGYYLVKKYESSTHVVTVDSTGHKFELYGDETYSTNKPKLYKVALAYHPGLIKEGQTPSKERELIDVTCYDDTTSQYVTGTINYSDITLNFINDPSKRPVQILREKFKTGESFIILYSVPIYKEYSFYEVKVTKVDGDELKFNDFQNYNVTLKVQEGDRDLKLD